MPLEITALLDKPHLLFLLLIFGALFGMTVERIFAKAQKRTWRQRKRKSWNTRTFKPSSIHALPSAQVTPPDAVDQLRIVMASEFSIQALLNRGEARLFKELNQLVVERNTAWQVMAQVSLGEILRSKDSEAYRCVNSKRVDLLLVDADCRPKHAIEYQGSGHHQGHAAARDAVKKEALRRAGIGYHEVLAGHTTPSELKRLVEKIVPAATP